MDYVQICDDVTPEYNKFYWMAARAIQEGDENDEDFFEELYAMDEDGDSD